MFREMWVEHPQSSQMQKAFLNRFEETLRSWVTSFLKDIVGKDEPQPCLVIFNDCISLRCSNFWTRGNRKPNMPETMNKKAN